MNRIYFVFLVLAGLFPLAGAAGQPEKSLDFLFQSGTEGYHTFRIPAIVTTANGTVLAFAEGRKNGAADTGDIDLVMRRSADNGRTWSALQVLWDDGDNVCGNPAPVVDAQTGAVFLLSTWNLGKDSEPAIIRRESEDTRRVFVLSSSDDGQSWTAPREITAAVKKENWTWYATGPVHGIQLKKGPHVGRLLIPCDHIEAETEYYYSHVIYSDDHGATWQLGGRTPQHQVNECTVAEIGDSALLLNMRNYDRRAKTRKIARSRDGGITWSNIYADPTLVEPICQASLLNFSNGNDGKQLLLFLNPADPDERRNMTLRVSEDEGHTWTRTLRLWSGPAAYSDMTQLADGALGCLYEAGRAAPYEGIIFRRVAAGELRE